MSILIKGIDMPKDCEGIELVFILKDGDIINNESMSIGAEQIVEIPIPHGRLIDDDRVTHEYYKNPSYQHLCTILNNAPTILEAEE